MITVAQAIAWLSECNPKAVLRVSYPDDSGPVESIEEVVNPETVYLGIGQIDWENEKYLPIEVIHEKNYVGTKSRRIKILQQQSIESQEKI